MTRTLLLPLLLMGTMAAGCADTAAQGDPVDTCTPLTTRTCPCSSGLGPGTSTCLSTGDGWSQCVCSGDVSGDTGPNDDGSGSALSPQLQALSPVTATGDLTSPGYRLRLHVGPPSSSETLVSPNYHLTLGAPAPLD